ncbi:MAG: hypothetical protein JO270_26185 [Acidobacteriaceae bacterium]|nr:hypothetical protein [Acidobacteriaceae bacterium]MBV8570086.1 hypothetical protein [Acidobacteriaceae bacterium]
MVEGLVSIKKALGSLNPQHVRELSTQRVHIALHAANQPAYERMEEFFLRELGAGRRRESALLLTRAPIASPADQAIQIHIGDGVADAPPHAIVFQPQREHHFARTVLATYPEAGVTLARSFKPFRGPFISNVISKTARENTLFSVSTALPDVIPNIIELPWAVAEFASDTAFLTMNQIRMAFLIAAASDREVGYGQQKSEVAGVIGSAFGWRALARELVGKIPFGGGLIAKAGIAYAGTRVMGLSLERYYSIGYSYTRAERDRVYDDALQHGRKLALRMLHYIRPDLAAKLAGGQAHRQPPV